MTKYSNEFKVKAIKMVLKGNSISHVAKILNMPDIAPLCRWISHYEHGGIPQLLHKNRKRRRWPAAAWRTGAGRWPRPQPRGSPGCRCRIPVPGRSPR